jgi:hypothetical protein
MLDSMVRFAQLTESAAKYKWFLLFFPIFLSAQVYQSLAFSWDPFVFHLQGKWFCGEHVYFEFLRSPLPGAVHCAFGAGENAPQLAVILACFLYLAALIFVFKKEKENGQKISQAVFAAFSLLFPTILWNANFGSDLFALSFLLIALGIQTKAKGLFFALSALSRYNFVLYAPVLLLQIKRKEWLPFFAVFLLVWAPWLAFNSAQTGNPFFSVEDFLYLNIVQKGIAAPLTPLHGALVLFFFASAVVAAGPGAKNFKNPFFQIGLVGILQFLFSGVKDTRFLAILVPLQALFLAKKIGETKLKNFSAFLLAGLLAVSLLMSIAHISARNDISQGGVDGYAIPDDEKIKECRVMSDQWVLFYAKGIVAEPLPREGDFGHFLKNGASIVIYGKRAGMGKSPDYDIIAEKNYLFLRPAGCAPQPKSFVLKVWRGDWDAKKTESPGRQ